MIELQKVRLFINLIITPIIVIFSVLIASTKSPLKQHEQLLLMLVMYYIFKKFVDTSLERE